MPLSVVAIQLSFSPLFIGAMVVTNNYVGDHIDWKSFSPLFIGAMVVTVGGDSKLSDANVTFSPLFIGAMVVTDHGRHSWIAPECPTYLCLLNYSLYHRIKYLRVQGKSELLHRALCSSASVGLF